MLCFGSMEFGISTQFYRKSRVTVSTICDRGTVCWWLIGVNAACFILQMLTRNPQTGRSTFTEFFQLDVREVWHGEVWRLLTYAFLHATETLWHILINMLLLYFFGRDVEEAYGPREFLCFYLLAAVLGGLAFLLLPLPTGGGVCIGASGAVIASRPEEPMCTLRMVPVSVRARHSGSQ